MGLCWINRSIRHRTNWKEDTCAYFYKPKERLRDRGTPNTNRWKATLQKNTDRIEWKYCKKCIFLYYEYWVSRINIKSPIAWVIYRRWQSKEIQTQIYFYHGFREVLACQKKSPIPNAIIPRNNTVRIWFTQDLIYYYSKDLSSLTHSNIACLPLNLLPSLTTRQVPVLHIIPTGHHFHAYRYIHSFTVCPFVGGYMDARPTKALVPPFYFSSQ